MNREIAYKPLCAMLAVFYVVTYYQSKGENGLKCLGRVVRFFFIASFIFFLATLLSPQAVSTRDFLYSGIDYASFDKKRIEVFGFRQGGLAGALFTFSYQVAAGAGLFISDVLVCKWRWLIVHFAALVLAILALVLGGERSPLIGLACALGLHLMMGGGVIMYKRLIIVVISLVVLSILFETVISELMDIRENIHLVERMTSEKSNTEAKDRIQVQLWALRMIASYPLGIVWAGESYDNMINKAGLELQIVPHNGYMTRTLFYGWPLAIVVVVIFRKVYQMGRAAVKWGGAQQFSIFAAVVAVLVNALFHNPSFLTFSPETVMLLLFLGGSVDYCVKQFGNRGYLSRVCMNEP